MCVKWQGEWDQSKEKIVAYKLVSNFKGKMASIVNSMYRIPQESDIKGVNLRYYMSQTISDPGVFGLYCYDNLDDAIDAAKAYYKAVKVCMIPVEDFEHTTEKDVQETFKLLRVLIPKGTLIRKTLIDNAVPGINAKELIVTDTIPINFESNSSDS